MLLDSDETVLLRGQHSHLYQIINECENVQNYKQSLDFKIILLTIGIVDNGEMTFPFIASEIKDDDVVSSILHTLITYCKRNKIKETSIKSIYL